MEIKNIIAQIKANSEKTEAIYLGLSNEFPKMLSTSSSSSCEELLKVFNTIKQAKSINQEGDDNIDNLGVRYKVIMDVLNQKINRLNEINSSINTVKDGSEQIAVIALNALVVSIKSGEQGRAFSCITDSLQRFSQELINLSGSLVTKKERLIEAIKKLKETFEKIQTDQNEITSNQIPSVFHGIDSILVAAEPLNNIIELSKSVYPFIRNAMESVQLQDIIKQALAHVENSLLEFIDMSDDDITKKLDTVTFNISLLELSKTVLLDLDSYYNKSIEVFDGSWSSVIETLNKIEQSRVGYIKSYLEPNSVQSVSTLIQSTVDSFNILISNIRSFSSEHRSIASSFNDITSNARNLRDNFGEFKPIITSLQHVQLLQSIEVAKNKAIVSVHDIVAEMDKLISQTNDSLSEIQQIIDDFIFDVAEMIENLSVAAAEDDAKMQKIQKNNTIILNEFQGKKELVLGILNCFNVFPPEFTQECEIVNEYLGKLKECQASFTSITNDVDENLSNLQQEKNELMVKANVTEWEVSDEKMKELIAHFTITSHKETAGRLAGFQVEMSSGADPGEITFF